MDDEGMKTDWFTDLVGTALLALLFLVALIIPPLIAILICF
jgi:hypothetical protein